VHSALIAAGLPFPQIFAAPTDDPSWDHP
jgi:hypothetical protein